MKVKELMEMLSKVDPNKNVFIACTPGLSGWVNDLLPHLGTTGEDEAIVIGAREEAVFEDEVDISWAR